MNHHDGYSPDALRPTELHDLSDVPFSRPSLGRAALVVIAIIAMFATAHRIAGVNTASNELVITQRSPVQAVPATGGVIRID